MARGTVVGENVVSQASTPEYTAGHERIFGKDKPIGRGRWVWDTAAQRLIPMEEYVPPLQAKNASIIADRIHEGVISPIDGTDIGSRRKRREHMKQHDLVDAGDVPSSYIERKAKERERNDDRSRRLAMQAAARKLYSQGRWE
jgi:hypothetical protein